MSAPTYNGVRHGVYGNTTDATQTAIATFDPPAKAAFFIEARAVCVNTGTFAGGGQFWRQALFVTDADGAIVQVGSTRTIGTDNESAAGYDFTIDTSGGVIRFLATGAAATNLSWLVDAYINECGQYVANAGAITG